MKKVPIGKRDLIRNGSRVVLAALVAAVAWGGMPCAAGDGAPSYLRGYEAAYGENPNAAAVAWFKDAKFGLFVHYALASVLEGGKPEFIKLTGGADADAAGEDKARYESVARDLFNRFTAENFDADAICDLAVAAKMRYVTFTTQHLGRMYMYRTKTSDFTSLKSPAGRDLVAEMAKACAKRGLGLFLYVPPEVARTDGEYLARNHAILRELLTQYGPIAGIWFDGIGNYYKTPANFTRLSDTFGLIRSIQPQCLVSFKEGAIGEEDFISPEHFLLPAPVAWADSGRQERWDIRMARWQKNNRARWGLFRGKPAEINSTMQKCMGRDGVYAPSGWINDENAPHLNAGEVMELLGVARSLNANFLINIGPRGDGSVHPKDAAALREVGERLARNGFPAKGRPMDDSTADAAGLR